jgi:hypothetical protein
LSTVLNKPRDLLSPLREGGGGDSNSPSKVEDARIAGAEMPLPYSQELKPVQQTPEDLYNQLVRDLEEIRFNADYKRLWLDRAYNLKKLNKAYGEEILKVKEWYLNEEFVTNYDLPAFQAGLYGDCNCPYDLQKNIPLEKSDDEGEEEGKQKYPHEVWERRNFDDAYRGWNPHLGTPKNKQQHNDKSCEEEHTKREERVNKAPISNPIEHTKGVPYPVYRAEYEKDHKIKIPGIGHPKEDCGQFTRVITCPECDYKQPIPLSCGRALCPVCWKKWAGREADNIADRILGFKNAYKKEVKGRRLGNPVDFIISPPKDTKVTRKEDIKKLKITATRLLKEAGIRGGVLIYHPYRMPKRIKERLQPLLDKNRYWDAPRENILNLNEWYDYVYLSSHFHGIGYGRIDGETVKKIYERTGWVIKFLRHLSNENEIFGKAFYDLSHSAIVEGIKAVSWFGSLSYNKLHAVVSKRAYEQAYCPQCGAPLEVEYVLTGIIEDYVIKIVEKTYYLKLPPPQRKLDVGEVIYE